MRHQNTIVTISLNILFCAALLWFFSRNAFLRPYLGSPAKETLSGLLLLATLYSNYFVFYPKLYRSRTTLYWLSVVAACCAAGCAELAFGYPFISQCQALRIKEVGAFHYFSKLLFMVFSRNLAFNFFPYMLGERKQLRQSLETEVRVVCQYARMLDVCDGDNNCQHIPIDDIFYCKKNGNETDVYTVGGVKYTRFCTIKYLIQLIGDDEFVRISRSFVVPFQHIASCDGTSLVMKSVPWTETPLAFDLDTQRYPHAPAAIEQYLRAGHEAADGVPANGKDGKGKKSLSVPPKEKLDAVLGYIREHPGCRSTELMSHTSYSQTTMDRCLFELKKRGLVEYAGSKKRGGYHLTNTSQDSEKADTTQPVEKATENERDTVQEKPKEAKSELKNHE